MTRVSRGTPRAGRSLFASVALFIAVVSGASCGSVGATTSGPSQRIRVDGSSTVYPILSGIADDFSRLHPETELIVNKSGTGSGMQKFARGEIEIAAASRPIEPTESQLLARSGIQFIEAPFAYDGVSVIVSRRNSFADSLTLSELRDTWRSGSGIKRWSDIRPNWPGEKIDFYGPTDNHGTYDYFADAVSNGSGSLRSDVQMNQEYNAIVQAVADDPDGMGYVGLNYFADNPDKVRAVPIDTGKGPVLPSQETVADGAYRELSRPLFLYINKEAYDSAPAIRLFVEFALSDAGAKNVADAHYVPLPEQTLSMVRRRVQQERTGSLFESGPAAISVAEVTRHESSGR